MLPLQKIPLRNKTKEWGKQTLDHFDSLSYSTVASNRTSNYAKKINYDLFNGIFNKADLEYVCNPLGLEQGEFPAELRHYDIVSPVFNLLIGEEAKRSDNCIVITDSPLDLNRKQTALKDRINQLLQQRLMQELDPSTIDPEQPLPTPDALIKNEKHTISDLVESKANKILKHLKKYLNTKGTFNRGWKDALLAGEEIYWTGVSNNTVSFRRCNPLNITVILDNDTDFVDDAIAVVEARMMSISSILDELGDELTTADIRKLEEMSRRMDTGYRGVTEPTFAIDRNTGSIVDHTGSGFAGINSTAGSYNSDMLRVVRVEWKSLKKLYYLNYTDEVGIEQDMIVDETFKIDIFKQSFPDASVEEFWVPEAWEGIKINDDIYVGIRPKTNQRRRMDNPYYCKLGYVGLIYNSTNSLSTSLMERVKPYQYLYNILMYRLELTVSRDDGKKFIMDVAQIPRSEGIDMERWAYYFKTMNIAFINSFEESRKGTRVGQTSQFNQFTSVDMTMANTIQHYVSMLDYIKQQVAFISGVTPQRLGAIENRELVGNVERSVQQSALITEYLFDSHNEVKRRCYTALVECAKIAFKDGLTAQYVLDDMGMEMLNLDEMEFENSEFNVFISDSSKDLSVVETLKQLAQIALTHDKATLSTIIDTIVNDNPRDIIRILQKSEAEAFERAQKMQEQESAMEQQKLQAEQEMKMMELEDKQLDRELKQYEIDTNNETKIMVAEINALTSIDGPTDSDGDGIPDPVEVARLSLDQRDLASKEFLEREKIKKDREKTEREVEVKNRELAMKKEVEVQKIRAIDVQNKSQEKMQREKIESDRKMAAMQAEAEKKRLAMEKEMKEKELKLKQQELEIKKSDLKNKI